MTDETWCFVANTATGHEFRCERCGSKYEPRMPMPVWAFCALIDGFVREHRDCVERRDGVANG